MRGVKKIFGVLPAGANYSNFYTRREFVNKDDLDVEIIEIDWWSVVFTMTGSATRYIAPREAFG